MQVLFFVYLWQGQVDAQVNCADTGAGRFPDESDTNCKNYTLCVMNTATNQFIAYNYTCPTTSVFNPKTSQCTTNYNCEASNSTTTTTTTATSTTTTSTTPTTAPTTTPTTTTTTPTTATTPITISVPTVSVTVTVPTVTVPGITVSV